MNTPLSEEVIFSCARRILSEDAVLTLQISKTGVRVKFPTTRRIAEKLAVPHYYVLPYFAGLEARGCLTRTERVGIFTTPEGTKELFSGMSGEELNELIKSCGSELFVMLGLIK